MAAVVGLRNEFAASANQRGRLIQMLVGGLAVSTEDAQVSYALGAHHTFTEVVQALDAMLASQKADESLEALLELDQDPNIDRLEDL